MYAESEVYDYGPGEYGEDDKSDTIDDLLFLQRVSDGMISTEKLPETAALMLEA